MTCVDYWPTTDAADAIVVDCYSEGQKAARYLLERGHRDLFFLGNLAKREPPTEKESDAELFLAGMQRGLELAGQPPLDSDRIRFLAYSPDCTKDVVQWLLSLNRRPTAGVVFRQQTCDQLIEQLEAQGVRCPEDISLMTKLHRADYSRTSSMRSDPYRMGELAVEMLLDRIRKPRPAGLRVAVGSHLYPGSTVRTIRPHAI